MFLPPKRMTIICLTATLLLLAAHDLSAQSASQYEARTQAFRAARARAQQQQAPEVQQTQYQEPVEMVNQEPRMAPANRGSQRSGRAFLPRHLQVAQLSESPIIENGPSQVYNPAFDLGIQSQVIQQGPVTSGCASGDCGDVGCSSCGDDYFDGGSFGGSCSSCPPADCWLSGLGSAFYKGEYFTGATAFRGPGFTINGTQVDDSNFGFYGGANIGIPLCKLSCGLLSGQLGVRSINTNFDGSSFTPDNRDQIFVTAGVYRRVDYGLQLGVVADILHEEWFTKVDLVQVRADLGWVYGNGSTLGFRSTSGTQDDTSIGIFNMTAVNGLVSSTVDQYRFYYQHACRGGGYGELSLGWTEDSQFVSALDFDVPVTNCFGMQSGFTYYQGDDTINPRTARAADNDGWNLYVGFVWRPQGRGWSTSYDRPMFDVADNGSMLIRR